MTFEKLHFFFVEVGAEVGDEGLSDAGGRGFESVAESIPWDNDPFSNAQQQQQQQQTPADPWGAPTSVPQQQDNWAVFDDGDPFR